MEELCIGKIDEISVRLVKNKLLRIFRLENMMVPALVGLGVGLNFSKEILIAYFFGASQIVDVYRIASSIPNSFFQSLGVVFVGLFLPSVLASSTVKLVMQTRGVMQASVLIILFGMAITFLYPSIFAPGMDDQLTSLLVVQGLLCWIGFSFMCMTFQRRIWLQANNKKYMVAGTSLINAFAFIASMYLFILLFGANQWVLVFSFITSGLFIFIAYKVSCDTEFTVLLQIKSLFLGERQLDIGKSVVVVAVLFHVAQLVPRIIDRSYASTAGKGAISYLEYAYNFHTALGMIVGTSIVILLSRNIASIRSNNNFDWGNIIRKTSGAVAISVICSVIIAFYAENIVTLVYMHGKFTLNDMEATSNLLTYLIFGLPFVVLNMILMQIVFTFGANRVLIISATVKVFVKLLTIEFIYSNFEYNYIFGVSNIISELCFSVIMVLMLRPIIMSRLLNSNA